MNKVDAYVKKVISEPIFRHDKWCITVLYNCYGKVSTQTLMFDNREEAEEVESGYKFKT